MIQKSEFIAEAFRVDSLEDIAQHLNSTRKKFYDATHHCYAYRLGSNAEIQKMSDDGEPAKTAGAPILDVLAKKELTNILVIVTRYFGGTLLGAGGLVRAYSNATSQVLQNVALYQDEPQAHFSLSISYSAYQTIQNMMPYIKVKKASFMSEVTLEAYCDVNLFNQIEKDAYTYKIGEINIHKIGVFPIEVLIDTSTE